MKLSRETVMDNYNPNQDISKMKIHDSIKIANMNSRAANDRI
jgi:hypothetical protein